MFVSFPDRPDSDSSDSESVGIVTIRSMQRNTFDPIHWQFQDRPMRRSRNSYWFIQWRPEGDLDLKPRDFMWVFVLTSFLYLLLPVVFMSLFVSFHVIIWHILSVWLPMLLHMTSWLYPLCVSLIWIFIGVILSISNSLLLGLVLLYSKVDLISYLT